MLTSTRAIVASLAVVALFVSCDASNKSSPDDVVTLAGPQIATGRELAFIGSDHLDPHDVSATDGFGSETGATARIHLSADPDEIVYLSTISPVYTANDLPYRCADAARKVAKGYEVLFCEDHREGALLVLGAPAGKHHGVLGSWERRDGRIGAWVETSSNDVAAQDLVIDILRDPRFRFMVDPEVVVDATAMQNYEDLEVTSTLTQTSNFSPSG